MKSNMILMPSFESFTGIGTNEKRENLMVTRRQVLKHIGGISTAMGMWLRSSTLIAQEENAVGRAAALTSAIPDQTIEQAEKMSPEKLFSLIDGIRSMHPAATVDTQAEAMRKEVYDERLKQVLLMAAQDTTVEEKVPIISKILEDMDIYVDPAVVRNTLGILPLLSQTKKEDRQKIHSQFYEAVSVEDLLENIEGEDTAGIKELLLAYMQRIALKTPANDEEKMDQKKAINGYNALSRARKLVLPGAVKIAKATIEKRYKENITFRLESFASRGYTISEENFRDLLRLLADLVHHRSDPLPIASVALKEQEAPIQTIAATQDEKIVTTEKAIEETGVKEAP